jgi:integrase
VSIYKKNAKWKAEVWFDSNRVATKSGFVTKNEAKDWRESVAAQYRAGVAPLPEQPSSTFDELLVRYESIHLPAISVATSRRYQVDINHRIRKFFRFRTLDSITPFLVESFRSEIIKDLSPKSVNNCMDLLSSIFRKAEEWGMIERNPVRLKSLKLSDRKYGWWEDKAHITAFLFEARKTPYFAVFKLALECGLRLGEIVGLSKRDIDFERCQVHIHRQWLAKHACYGPTKGRKERFVPFSPHSGIVEALKEAIARSPHPEAIVVTRTGQRILPGKLSEYHFHKIVTKSKVPRIRFHDLRHTFASWYMIQVGDIWSLKSILGHVDIQTTQRYAHLSVKHHKVDTLSWVIPGVPEIRQKKSSLDSSNEV